MAHAGLGYVDAVKDLAASVGMQVPDARPLSAQEIVKKEREADLFDLMSRAMEFYRAELKKSSRAIEYLKGRGLTGEIAGRFRIGFAPDGWQNLQRIFDKYDAKELVECGLVVENEGKRYDRFRDRIIFPIFNARGAVIGFGGRVLGQGEPKYLNSPETTLFQKGQEIYGLVQARDAIRTAGRVLVVEGYMDVVALAQFQVGYAVATLGTATTAVHVAKLLRLTDEIVYCFDGDAAGRKAAWRALEVSLPVAPDNKPIKFLFLPEGEDPDTFIRKHGKEKFEELVRKAETLSQFLLNELRSQSDLQTNEGRSQFVSAAKGYIEKVAAPILRIQLINSVAELGRISQEEIRELLGGREKPRFRNVGQSRAKVPVVNRTHEWTLLYSVLTDLPMFVHIDPSLLRDRQPETQALLAIRRLCESSVDDLSFRVLLDGLKDDPSLGLVLEANRYAEELGFDDDEVRADIQWALARLDVVRREKELEALRATGLVNREDRVKYQRKLDEFSLLRGAVRREATVH
jgi:DNA primase